jgi:2-iminobutanoate/2-iminopropanoate deaminase
MPKLILSILVLVLSLSAPTLRSDKKIILPTGAKPPGNWSHGVLVDGTLYISGMGGEDANGKIPDDFETEVKQSLDNIGGVLKAAGMSPADVVSVQVYLTDKQTFQRMNSVYRSYFQEPRPTRTTVVVAALLGPGRIEITATARK